MGTSDQCECIVSGLVVLDDATEDHARRDRYGRYLVATPDGGTKPVSYTRATTIAKAIEDQHSLIAWKARVTAIGLTKRPELLKMIAVTDDKKRLDQLCEDAAASGGATERRDEGTALHRAIERSFGGEAVPEMFRADVDAVRAELERHGFAVVPGMTEVMVVDDARRIAGTFDLLLTDGTTVFVADIKTGASLDYSGCSFAAQLAIYANAAAIYHQGRAADGSQDERRPMPEVSRDVALILHVQPNSARCAIHTVDIAYGAELVELNIAVREARTRGRKLIAPLGVVVPATALTMTTPTEKTTAVVETSVVIPSEVVAAGLAPLVPQSKREWLVERAKALRAIDPTALDKVAALLPPGTTALGGRVMLTRSDFDLYDAAIAAVERAIEAPFVPAEVESPTPSAVYDPTPPAPPEPRRTFDEGDPIDDETIAAMLAKMGTLAGTDGEHWARQILREAKDAGVPISLRATRSTRMFQITRALYAWAEAYADDELARCALVYVLGDDRVQPGFPTGAVIGSLDIVEAGEFLAIVWEIERAHLVYVVDAQGSRLERAAN